MKVLAKFARYGGNILFRPALVASHIRKATHGGKRK